jgi:glycosyltransferase involved in cell wall biosynthesis
MKVALVHDWLTGMRGGEKCLEVFCELFPGADLYTLVYRPERVSAPIRAMSVRSSWLDRIPGSKSYYRYALPFFPRVIEGFDFAGYDLILSSSHCVAKGVLPQGGLHISYVHAPMRYVWDMHDAYFGRETSRIVKVGISWCRRYLQNWDIESARRVDSFVANSRNIAAKIETLYGRKAIVIYPPVNVQSFSISHFTDPYYLIVSALVPYKGIGLAIDAFNRLGLKLKIAGDGPLRKSFERASARNVEFLGWVDDQTLADLYRRCQALIFPGEEDFGIVPLEAQASGRPVIAYGKGGALETVVPWMDGAEDPPRASPTGIFFSELTSESLIQAVQTFERVAHRFQPGVLRAHATKFSRERFKSEIKEHIDDCLASRDR